MRKRLRKKKHLQEFCQYGFEIAYKTNLPIVPENLNEEYVGDRLITFAETENLWCYGAYSRESGDFIIMRKPGTCTTEDRLAVREFIAQQPEVVSFQMSELIDIWYPPKVWQ